MKMNAVGFGFPNYMYLLSSFSLPPHLGTISLLTGQPSVVPVKKVISAPTPLM